MSGVLKEICETLDEGKALIEESAIVEFQKNAEKVQAGLAEILKEGRVLRLGIVGEVKAGKSSFLNALLFEGKDVLPKAPTPMTAALTKLSYSKQPQAHIVFYSRDEWNGIQRLAEKYDQQMNAMYSKYCQKFQEEQDRKQRRMTSLSSVPIVRRERETEPPQSLQRPMTREAFERQHRDDAAQEYRDCKEVWELAKRQGVAFSELLGQEKTVAQAGGSDNYLEQLNDYVGAEGRYTPIVKYTEIQLDNPLLEGVEVIDTPGLNDPVNSRSQVTKDFLTQCDAVFLLSYCGQFLGADDIEFMTRTLPNEGIQKAFLVGSKLDSSILQYNDRSGKRTFQRAYRGTVLALRRQAEERIRECRKDGIHSPVIEQIEKSFPPILISSMAYSAALKQEKGESLSEEEQNIVNLLSRFPDFSPSQLKGLSSIPDVQDTFDETRRQKDQIIQKRIQEFAYSQRVRFTSDLEKIYASFSSGRSDLENFDCAQDEKHLEQMRRQLDAARIKVNGIFEKAAVEVKRSVVRIADAVRKEMDNHLAISVNTDKKTQHHSSTKGHLFWKKTEHWDEIITTHVAEVGDAEKNLRRYQNSSVELVNSAFRELIEIETVKNSVRDAVMKAYDLHAQDFDADKILIPLENALSQITIPDIELDYQRYNTLLAEKLTGIVTKGVVKNEDIPELKRMQDQVLDRIAQDLVEKIKAQGQETENQLRQEAGSFVDSIVEELNDKHRRLEDQISNKRENLQRYDALLKKLREAKQRLQQAKAEEIFES